MRFTKMHGLRNDYIYVNCFEETVENPSEVAKKGQRQAFWHWFRRTCTDNAFREADFKMRMFNSDGSEAEMCGNAIRCVGKYVFDRGMTNKNVIRVETLAGIKVLELTVQDGKAKLVKVDMGNLY